MKIEATQTNALMTFTPESAAELKELNRMLTTIGYFPLKEVNADQTWYLSAYAYVVVNKITPPKPAPAVIPAVSKPKVNVE